MARIGIRNRRATSVAVSAADDYVLNNGRVRERGFNIKLDVSARIVGGEREVGEDVGGGSTQLVATGRERRGCGNGSGEEKSGEKSEVLHVD